MHSNSPLSRHRRLVHLDFHTSEQINDVAVEFDATEFIRTFKEAHVNAVTVFAKCHHGMSYYPTSVGTQHPALNGRDLLGEQIDALRSSGIFCPIYTTVAWEENAARLHPEWRQVTSKGQFCEARHVADAGGSWKWLNFVNPDYLDYIEEHVKELISRYNPDGFFFDILFYDNDACWSDASIRFRQAHGLMTDDLASHRAFELEAQKAFTQRFSSLIKSKTPNASIFYNQTNYLCIDHSRGVRAFSQDTTHFELESLPSGQWGYHHFPRYARQVSSWGTHWLAQTGRFQRMWGDFGGIKPQAALEYECFRTQALGGALGIGDQLPPRGTLDAAAYKLIGSVYVQCEAAEPFYAGTIGVPQVGVFLANYPGCDETVAAKSIEAAVLMCEEAHYDVVVLDDDADFTELDLVILPDTSVVSPDLAKKLEAFVTTGGKLLFSYRAGNSAHGEWSLPFIPLAAAGDVDQYPTYWRSSQAFNEELALSDRVIYSQGMNMLAGDGVRIEVERVLPYFKRTDQHFSSHFQTPPIAESDKFGAVLSGDSFVYFADPIFREYRQTGNLAIRDGWKSAMQQLIGVPPIGNGLPTTVLSVPRRSGNDLCLTLLHYVPVRKALDIDVIEERMGFAGLKLFLPAAHEVLDATSGVALERSMDGSFVLPSAFGRLLLTVPDYWK